MDEEILDADSGDNTMRIAQRIIIGTSEDMSMVKDKSVDFFITSPPYWNLKKYGSSTEIGQSSYDEYLRRLNVVWDQCYQKGKNGAVLAINVNVRRNNKRFYPIPFDIAENMKGWVLWDVLIWYIPNALPQPNHYMERLFDNKFEYVLIFVKDGNVDYKFHKPRVPQKYLKADPRAKKHNSRGRCLGNVLRIPAALPGMPQHGTPAL